MSVIIKEVSNSGELKAFYQFQNKLYKDCDVYVPTLDADQKISLTNDPALDYHNLEGVHHGGEAMELFPKIKDMPPEEQAVARHNLLKYCELDTYAMVKVWEELVRVTK